MEINGYKITDETIIVEVPHQRPDTAYTAWYMLTRNDLDVEQVERGWNDCSTIQVFNERGTVRGNLRDAFNYYRKHYQYNNGHQYARIFAELMTLAHELRNDTVYGK